MCGAPLRPQRSIWELAPTLCSKWVLCSKWALSPVLLTGSFVGAGWVKPPSLGVWVDKVLGRKRRKERDPRLGWVGAFAGLGKRKVKSGFKGWRS